MTDDSPYLVDASGYTGFADRIQVARDEQEVAAILREAGASHTPVTISGAGTGLTGGRVPQGGWVLSLERMNAIDIQRGFATCGAGVLLKDLQAAALPSRQFYAPDPTEWGASIGGTIATNASGSRSFLYGDTRRHVQALRVVLASGEVLALRRGDKPPFELPALEPPASTKNTAGYYLRPGMDYLDVFIGSEGTLGVVTEAELVLLPIHDELFTGVVFFESDAMALAAVDLWRPVAGLRMLEYVDIGSLELLRSRFPEIPAEARAALLIEQEIEAGEDAEEEWLNRLEESGALIEASWFAASAADRERFRRFRHVVPEAVNDVVRRNKLTKMGSDFAVPVARNGDMLRIYRETLDREFPGRYVIFGHIGDAHLHVNILPETDEEWSRAKVLMKDLARRAVELGGTVSAEHGLGKRKRDLLPIQFSESQIESMRQVKAKLDPDSLLGRGTVFEVGI
ncbi:MAG: FAD-binding oxidoreductase [Acidobacteriota bacterium]|nr:FAD-binding oxidoreductase [Acidobacteriota bacterium]